LFGDGSHKVDLKLIGTRRVGFLQIHSRVARAEAPKVRLEQKDIPKGILERLAFVVFIPTKYRVYSDLIDGKVPEPAPAISSLRSLFPNVKIIDLTATLRSKAEELVNLNELVFLPDDTHWNRNGIAVAAKVVANVINQLPAEQQELSEGRVE